MSEVPLYRNRKGMRGEGEAKASYHALENETAPVYRLPESR